MKRPSLLDTAVVDQPFGEYFYPDNITNNDKPRVKFMASRIKEPGIMRGSSGQNCIAFEGVQCIGHGSLRNIAPGLMTAGRAAPLLVFDDASGELVELDLRGSEIEVLARLEAAESPPQEGSNDADAAPADKEKPRRGRPRLGVVAREVTLLPRHWAWLERQPGGASVTLRRLVEHARREGADAERVRVAREAAYRFMSAIAGNAAGFENATRALFAGDEAAFAIATEGWPSDIKAHAARLFERSVANGQTENARATG